MISCRNLSFYYGKRNILNNVSINLPCDGVYALIGENGVGKTTFLKIILNILKTNGVDNSYLEDSSFALSEDALYDNLTVYENLYYHALLNGIAISKIDGVINDCHISSYKDIRVKKLSKGTKQKVLIAKCLLQDVHLYIFDEPYNGLDPKESINFNNLVIRLKEKGKLVIISSHILSGINDIYDYIILIKDKDIHLYDKNNMHDIKDFFREDI